MRQSIIILCCFSIPFSFWGQLTRVVTYYDEVGLKSKIKNVYYLDPNHENMLSGEFLQFFESGELAIQGQYSSNTPVGEWSYYFENGALKNRALLETSEKGYWWYYYEQGGLRKKGALIDNKEHGKWSYFYENQVLRKSGDYRKGLKEGDWNYFYEDSVKKGQAFYEHNQGIYREYYYDGTIKMEGPVQDDLPEGLWNYYYKGGQIKAQGLELSGKKSGLWKYYYTTGQLLKKGHYGSGELVGDWEEYSLSGNIYSKGSYNQSSRQGDWFYFGKEGEATKVVFESNVGVYKEYYPNGNLKARGNIVGSTREGKWLYLFPNGAKKGECVYSNNKGKYVGYFQDGGIESKGLLIGAKREGIWELHDKKGQIVYLRTIYDQSSTSLDTEGALEVVLDSVLIKNIEDVAVQTKSNKVFKYKPIKQWRKGRRWAIPKSNEAKGIVLTIDPMALFINVLSADVEYIIQERQAWSFGASYYNQRLNVFGNRGQRNGYEVSSCFKIYSRNSRFGMTSIGPSLKYKTFEDSQTLKLDKSENVELTVILGKLFVKSFKQNSVVLKGGLNIGAGYDFDLNRRFYLAYAVEFGVGWLFR